MKRITQIKATPCKAEELEPGDLWSAYGQEYWNRFPARVASNDLDIASNTALPSHLLNVDVFRIEIITEEN